MPILHSPSGGEVRIGQLWSGHFLLRSIAPLLLTIRHVLSEFWYHDLSLKCTPICYTLLSKFSGFVVLCKFYPHAKYFPLIYFWYWVWKLKSSFKTTQKLPSCNFSGLKWNDLNPRAAKLNFRPLLVRSPHSVSGNAAHFPAAHFPLP